MPASAKVLPAYSATHPSAPHTSHSCVVGLAKIARGQWGTESVYWLRDTVYAGDSGTGYAGNGPQVMATLRNLAISLLYLSGVKRSHPHTPGIARDRTRILDYLPL